MSGRLADAQQSVDRALTLSPSDATARAVLLQITHWR
jgi:hypothetical protein